jgi:hypothetical protein
MEEACTLNIGRGDEHLLNKGSEGTGSGNVPQLKQAVVACRPETTESWHLVCVSEFEIQSEDLYDVNYSEEGVRGWITKDAVSHIREFLLK